MLSTHTRSNSRVHPDSLTHLHTAGEKLNYTFFQQEYQKLVSVKDFSMLITTARTNNFIFSENSAIVDVYFRLSANRLFMFHQVNVGDSRQKKWKKQLQLSSFCGCKTAENIPMADIDCLTGLINLAINTKHSFYRAYTDGHTILDQSLSHILLCIKLLMRTVTAFPWGLSVWQASVNRLVLLYHLKTRFGDSALQYFSLISKLDCLPQIYRC